MERVEAYSRQPTPMDDYLQLAYILLGFLVFAAVAVVGARMSARRGRRRPR